MEPDHCASMEAIIRRYPSVQIVSNAKTQQMIRQFFDMELDGRTILVKEGDELNLGAHTLQFFMAPMVHWPEVMVTYEKMEKILFSADGFGSFGALNGTIFNDEIDMEHGWIDDARRYYTNIVGKYGAQVQALLKKAAGLDIKMICPLHGPVWRSNLEYFIGKYDQWSRYEAEEKGVLIVYGSMYGNTENAANVLSMLLAARGVKTEVYDASVTDISYLISEAFRYSHIVVAAPTYNGEVYPPVKHFIQDMKSLNLQNRTVAVLDNGSWASTAGKHMKNELSEMKNVTVLEETVSLKSSLKDQQMEEMEALCRALADSGAKK